MIALDRVSRTFQSRGHLLRAVDEVSLELPAGQVLCLVGESGSGKTTIGKLLAGLLPPTSGRVLFEGLDVRTLRGRAWQRYRRSVQIIHQDPYASLNPVRTAFATLASPLGHFHLASGKEMRARVCGLLERVELTPPDVFVDKFPHQLSGGQRQRVAVARALSVEPRFIVADEPVSMIDVSLRISLLALLLRLRRENGMGFLFITHDLALARHFGWEGRVAVMYLGRVVEIGPTSEVIGNSQHPYTRALLAAVPEADPRLTRSKARLRLRSQDPPSLLHLPSGCAFHPRCPWAERGLCEVVRPELSLVAAHEVACLVAARAGTLPDLARASEAGG